MCDVLCRICGKAIKEKDPTNIFDSQNKKILLQIKDLTGIRLKNNPSLPKCMCCICKNDLIDAYKFREDFLRVQASFRIKCSKGNKKQTRKDLIEETEFVQVFVVKEERDVAISENEDCATDEEKEINIIGAEDSYKKEIPFKDSRDEVNALELKPNEENTLEDTKIALEEINKKIDIVCGSSKVNSADEVNALEKNVNDKNTSRDTKVAIEDTKNKIYIACGTSKAISEDEDLDDIDADEDYEPVTEINKTKKSRFTRKMKKSEGSQKENDKVKQKVSKSGRKRKNPGEHSTIFICDQCGNNFTCRHHFKLHLRRHSGDKRCACELCPDKFFTSSELRRHMRRHTGERPFACKYCDRRFTDYSTRLKHERTHTNERPFMCSQCGKSFTTSYILKNHMLTHTGERHFKCELCNRAFTRRTHLVVHFRSIMHKQAVEKEKLPSSQEGSP